MPREELGTYDVEAGKTKACLKLEEQVSHIPEKRRKAREGKQMS